MRVLLLLPTLDQSGAEKQFSLLATHLPKADFEVQVVALTRGGPFEEVLRAADIPVTILNKRSKFDLRAISQLRKLILLTKPDVVISCLFAGNAYARLVTIGLGTARPKIIISERCVDVWKSRWQLWLDRLLRSHADCLVGNSKSVAEFYESQGFPKEKIRVIPNAVETPPLPGITRQELCDSLNIPTDAKLVAFVGRLAKQKRLPDLIWAAQILRQVDEKAYFLIIGDGPERNELELYARDVEAIEHVRFLGHREDASSLLHLVDVFWLASQFEGMSNSLMEAMSCGKAVVVSDIPPNRELVSHGTEGWIVNLKDSVGFSQYTVKLFEDPTTSAKMGNAGKSRMQNQHSLAKMVAAYAKHIREVLS